MTMFDHDTLDNFHDRLRRIETARRKAGLPSLAEPEEGRGDRGSAPWLMHLTGVAVVMALAFGAMVVTEVLAIGPQGIAPGPALSGQSRETVAAALAAVDFLLPVAPPEPAPVPAAVQAAAGTAPAAPGAAPPG